MMIRWLNREILIGTGSNEFGWISTSSVDPFLSFPSTLQSITGFVNVLHVSSTVIHDERLEHERFLLISILLLNRLHDFHRNVQIDRVYNSKPRRKAYGSLVLWQSVLSSSSISLHPFSLHK